METTGLLHHYTSIETLALILKSRKIRFNRLDRVDDVTEATAFGEVDLSKYLFVSCWTDEQDESLQQWKMYTPKTQGVRISVPRPPFHYRPIKPSADLPFEIRGDGETPIPFDRLVTSDYFIVPTFALGRFEGKVEYIDDVAAKYREMVQLKSTPGTAPTLNISGMFDLARYKHKRWAFQSEVRYSLFIVPSLPLPPSGVSDAAHIDAVMGRFVSCVIDGIPPGVVYYDVEIAPEVVDNILVTLGPNASEADRILVEALLEKYTAAGRLERSELTGQIREPMR